MPRPARSRTLLIVANLLVAVIGFGAGVAWFALPDVLEREVRTRLAASAGARGLTLAMGGLWVRPLHGVVIDDLALAVAGSAEARPLVTLDRLEVRWELSGLRPPKLYLHEIAVRGGTLRLRRNAAGVAEVQPIIERLLTGGTGDDASGSTGGLRAYLSDHVPALRATDLALEIDDEHGAPMLAGRGVDLRHLRLAHANVSLEDRSPVRERLDLDLRVETQVAGLPDGLTVTAQLAWPKREGGVQVQLPPGLAIEQGGFRIGLTRVELDSKLELVLRDVEVDRVGERAPLSMRVRRIVAHLDRQPRSLETLPATVRDRLPTAALTALRHVRAIRLEDPELVGERPAPEEGASDDVAAEEAVADRQLMPRSSKQKDGERKEAGARKREADKVAATAAAKKAGSSKKEKGRDDEIKAEPGAKVRSALALLLSRGADGLQRGLDAIRVGLGALPFERIELVRGRARYRDERPRAAGATEVSDFHATLERKDATLVDLQVSFDTPGGARDARNEIKGRVDVRRGDATLQVRLDRLPVAPYGALLPRSLRAHGDSIVRAKRIELRYDAKARTLALEGGIEATHLDVHAPRLARHLIADLSLRASGKAAIALDGSKIALEQGEVAIGEVVALVEGSVQRFRTAPAFDATIKVPSLGCQAAVDSLVGPIAPMLAGARCKGSMSFRVGLGLDTADMSSLRFEFDPVLRGVQIESLGRYIDFEVLRGPFEQHARQRDGSLYTFVTGPGAARWVPLPQINEWMTLVVTTTEDGSFFWHKGFSLTQIRGAMVDNLQRGRFVRGASTISQQVVKNLFFVEREKTISRKLQEAVVTWEFEHRFSKEEILELYFNIIEFGPLIYGIRAASTHYFNREPAALTPLQAIWLGSIIPSPRGHYHHFTKGGVSDGWRKTLCWIADVMVKREKITAEQRARLGHCEVVFGGGDDGSAAPPDKGLQLDGALDADALLENDGYLPGVEPDAARPLAPAPPRPGGRPIRPGPGDVPR
ncbi:MAG: transglycosylase domain-containing protein [Deltaproteobacteria bacterium]|nr:transglycosylase domain-containing protein [Deltaproteobacteria bacterium]